MHFNGSKIRAPGPGPSWILGPSFQQTWWRTTRQCNISNFKHLGQEVIKKKIFEYFSIYFYGSNLGHPGTRPSWTLDVHLNKLGKITLDNATDQISSIWAKWLQGRRFLIHFYGLNLGAPGPGHLEPWDRHLNKLGKEPLGNAIYQISHIFCPKKIF